MYSLSKGYESMHLQIVQVISNRNQAYKFYVLQKRRQQKKLHKVSTFILVISSAKYKRHKPDFHLMSLKNYEKNMKVSTLNL